MRFLVFSRLFESSSARNIDTRGHVAGTCSSDKRVCGGGDMH